MENTASANGDDIKQIPSSQSSNLTQMEINSGNPVLPPDLIASILVRLPVKSLIRFQCVCKEWKNLFKTQSFIAEHLHHSTHQNPFLFFEDFAYLDPYRVCLLNREMQVLDVQNDPFIDSIFCVWTYNSCNGLICLGLTDVYGPVYLSLWNPATREMRLISEDIDEYCNQDLEVGIGFSSIVNDYKIVKIRDSCSPALVTQVEVYSLNIGTWKEVELGKLDGVAISSHGLAFDGAIFWIGIKPGVNIIVLFDIATEVFTLMPMPPLPPSPIPETPYCKYLSVHENKLAVLSHTLTEDFKSSLIHLWVMDEGPSAFRERWCRTKKCTSSPYQGRMLTPMAIWRNEIVCDVDALPFTMGPVEDEDELNGGQKNVLFNFTTNEFKRFNIRKFGDDCVLFSYVESLVPIGNIHLE